MVSTDSCQAFLAAIDTGQVVGVALWVGLGSLTLSLVVLSWTRWGQVRPLSKCMALSLLAHALLLLYAYGTRLFLAQPPAEETIMLTIGMADEEGNPMGGSSGLALSDLPSEPAPASDELPPRPVEPAEPAPDSKDAPPVETEVPVERAQPPVAAANRPPDTASAPEVAEIHPLVERQAPPVAAVATPQAAVPQTPSDPTSALPGAAKIDEVPQVVPTPADERWGNTSSANAGEPAELATVTPEPLPSDAAPGVTTSAAPTAAAATAVASVGASGDGGRRWAPPAAYSNRLDDRRDEALRRYGGSRQAAEAVTAALKWLASAQSADGRWNAAAWGGGLGTGVDGQNRPGTGADADTGITGLALLAFLGAGNSHLAGPYQPQVQHGLEFLLRSQAADGNLAGNASLFSHMYCHGIATFAISEALAMTGDQRLEPYVERAVQYSVRAQHPTLGGWRYRPGDMGDMSQFGWQVMALSSAEQAGIATPAATRYGMRLFLSRAGTGASGGLCGYRVGERVTPTMTAEGLACRFFLRERGDAAARDEAARFLRANLPAGSDYNVYYWYYGTLAMFQRQGDDWNTWNAALLQALLPLEHRAGPVAGSWDPDRVWGGYGGRIFSTSMAALCLEVYYRYLPTAGEGN